MLANHPCQTSILTMLRTAVKKQKMEMKAFQMSVFELTNET